MSGAVLIGKCVRIIEVYAAQPVLSLVQSSPLSLVIIIRVQGQRSKDILTSERRTRVNTFLSSAPFSLAAAWARRGTSMAGVLMLGLADINISLYMGVIY